MTDNREPTGAAAAPTLEQLQQWTGVIGQAQQMMMEYASAQMARAKPGEVPRMPFADPNKVAQATADFWSDSVKLWERFVTPAADAGERPEETDRRFQAAEWRDNPLFDLIRQSYDMIAGHLLKGVDAIEGVDGRQREQIRFAARAFNDAMAPTNFALTNPTVMQRAIDTNGQSLLKGLEHMLADIGRGQLTHTDPNAFELGRNIAATPGKVIKETPLYQLIHYAPVTEDVLRTPLLIFPPWINRFYILDLSPEKSFIKWATEQGVSVFVVSWKSADASIADVTMDDYVLRGQVDAIDTVRDLLGVEAVHAIGYCVAGTALATTLALLAARNEAGKVASATFFTAQIDFEDAGDLTLFIDEEQLALQTALSKDTGYLDGRYMAATFNMLRGRDLIWNYVVNNYLLGEDYPPFDLLHWNSDTTNLPAKWHQGYLSDLYRENKLAKGRYSIDGTPIELKRIATPAYIQAGREDHIAPAASVWKMVHHLQGPVRFVLAGSGHIAGVVNPPAKGKYQYWRNDDSPESLDAFVAGAREIKGSWWPDWVEWVRAHDPRTVPAEGARLPGGGKLTAIEDAPGHYVRSR